MLLTLILKRFTRKCKHFKDTMSSMSSERLCNAALEIFDASIQSVKPQHLVKNAITLSGSFIQIKERKFPVDHNIHLVGFGKAVLDMAVAIESILGTHLVSGIISVPKGIQSRKVPEIPILSSKIQVLEGAANNLPDENSLLAASKISELVFSMTESQILLVLISGGGSALLPAPKPPLTLQEKHTVITLLASKGAVIEEINVIRKQLSSLKGGGLALLAKPAQVISLILSDIIGDPLDLIASGPTSRNVDDTSLPLAILDKYSLKNQIPPTALHILQNLPKTATHKNEQDLNHVCNFIIGNNSVALNAAATKAKSMGFNPILITSELRGTAAVMGSTIIHLVSAALKQNGDLVKSIFKILNLPLAIAVTLQEAVSEFKENGKGLCLLFGGETTVEVKGKGIGGRNQELALSAALQLSNEKCEHHIVLLSAGSDGIDGPTTAAGAIATSFLVDAATEAGFDASKYLNENDSYSFFSSFGNGQWHVKTGHTGTNVMDIIVVLVERCIRTHNINDKIFL